MIDQILIGVAGLMLAVAAVFALVRLAKGPTSLDRGVASDVLLVILAVAAAGYALWADTPMALVVSLALSLLGFTSAVGLARLITATTAQERRFREAEARAYAARAQREGREQREQPEEER
ncbi:monovalent cation/H+ antiporter complex subunit F [Propioniciclava soli]|uniref:Monovalent cation/H+ antiporter complex subunit F n=1 Tax=Propioniciclava soli TaxID=2775081 RepID=A0ABZ3C4B0_9ACTN